ncbi:hypothetical protein [Ottowia sp.]|uniref:hypothetical protein n=1 Tax=Ottowia sp. TaxID=1898956 RepID=UPI0025CF121E|nr:hypothetical protein [Ottowia sp.]MBK6616693.1 hypothetical protein [Ottowia sp.]
MVDQAQLDFDGRLMAGSVKGFMKDTHSSSRDLWQVNVELIRVKPGFNVRINGPAKEAHIRRLADSMKEEGFFQDKPLAGFVAKEGDDQVFYVTDGHCRLEAAKIAIQEGAQIERLPAVAASAGTSEEDLTVALVRANDGLKLEPLEIAIVCKRLVRFNMEVKDIARRLGFSTNYVDGLLMLIGAPIELRDMVESGTVAASTAIETLRDHGDKALDKLRAGLDAAKAKGKDRVTSKHIPGADFKKLVKKAAPTLFVTLREVRTDPGYAGINEALRTKLETLLSQLDSLEGVSEALAAEEKKAQQASKGKVAKVKREKAAKPPKEAKTPAKKGAAVKRAPAAKKA